MELSFEELRNASSRIGGYLRRLQFGNRAQLAFLEDLYVLISDGIPPNRAIDMMTQITTGVTQEVAISISNKIAEGQALADGMRDWFSVNVVEIIRVGESGGALSQTMKSAINMLSQRGVAIGSFIGALTYPLIVIIMACVVIIYLDAAVFTQFATIKPMEQWPESGRRLIAMAEIIKNWWWVIIASVITIILIFRYAFSNYVGEFRPMLDRIPPFSFYRQLVASRFLETLGLLVANGVVFKSAIRVMQYQANPYLHSHLIMMEHLLGMGKTNIADVLATGLIEPHDLMRLRIMAEVKGFEHGLVRMGIHGTEKATATLKFISRIIGGLFLIIGALLIIAIVQGVYLTGMSMGTGGI